MRGFQRKSGPRHLELLINGMELPLEQKLGKECFDLEQTKRSTNTDSRSAVEDLIHIRVMRGTGQVIPSIRVELVYSWTPDSRVVLGHSRVHR